MAKVKIDTSAETVRRILTSGTEQVIDKASLKRKLQSGKVLRVKLGMDPTRPDLHLGHAVVLRKLKQFQDAGHQVVFIIGDFTALIGDPSGKSKTRPPLTPDEIARNAETYFEQVGRVLNVASAEICYNGEWLNELGFEDVVKLTAKFTIARILERDDFTNRYHNGVDIGLHEFLYPVMQAYDSVAKKADVELGGTDQTFNVLAGRELMKKMDMVPQDVITMPLLIGLDGMKKMSKSLDNYIALADSASEMFGKLMSIPDDLILHYADLAAFVDRKTRTQLKKRLDGSENPRDVKEDVARMIVTMYHDKAAAEKAAAEFVRVFKQKKRPAKMPRRRAPGRAMKMIDLLVRFKLAESKSAARRLVNQGGVRVNDRRIADPLSEIKLKPGDVIQVGKRRFIEIN